ncbi:hypothetical protein Q5M85_21865 [Paraclostridium bifermentans]|nr:hypothetical protein [Paraclostridium bifermentans]
MPVFLLNNKKIDFCYIGRCE